MKFDNFFGDFEGQNFHVSSYFYRIEFQQRGSPHVHSLLWMKDEENEEAPSFWNNQNENKKEETETDVDQDQHVIGEQLEIR